VDADRASFYRRAVQRLLDDGVLERSMSVLVTCGGRLDRDVLSGFGFGDVTITNLDERLQSDEYAPYPWRREDAEALTFEDGAFDWGVVAAGLHHCRSPHRALLELYRVSRRGVLGMESRDSTAMRAAVRAGLVDDYEVGAVAAHGLRAGGVANTAVPNYVYRWTEREVEKTIASYAPHARHRFLYLRELEVPEAVLASTRGARGTLLRALAPMAKGAARVLPGQANLFAFAVVKEGGLQPWLREGAQGPEPDEAWLRERYVVGPPSER
jgi:SAM-dependent methyltransferase